MQTACLPVCRSAGLPVCPPACLPGVMLQCSKPGGWWLVAGGWWLVAGGLRAACPNRGGREGLELGVSVTAASENNFSKFFISAS